MDDKSKAENPMDHPDEQPTGADGMPRFGRLLIVLLLAVGFMVFVTLASQAWLG